MFNQRFKKQGVSLIELVIVIAVLAISAPSLVLVFSQFLKEYANVQYLAEATIIAQDIMNELLLVDFYAVQNRDNETDNCPINFSDWVTYLMNNNCPVQSIEPRYRYTIQAKYVNPNYNGNFSDGENPGEGAVVDHSNFLRLRVRVHRVQLIPGQGEVRLSKDAELMTIVTPHYY